MAVPHPAAGRPREWDAASYDALPLPHERWGRRLLATRPLRGDETVLDVGDGTGRDTAALLEHLPRGRVIAVDGSVAMLSRLRARLAGPVFMDSDIYKTLEAIGWELARDPGGPAGADLSSFAAGTAGLLEQAQMPDGYLTSSLQQYTGAQISTALADGTLGAAVSADFPWSGEVTVRVTQAPAGPCGMAIRVPSWSSEPRLQINGTPAEAPRTDRGYLLVHLLWQSGEVLAWTFDVAPRWAFPHPRIDAVRGCAVIERARSCTASSRPTRKRTPIWTIWPCSAGHRWPTARPRCPGSAGRSSSR